MSIADRVLLVFQNHIWQLDLGIGFLLGLGVSIGGMLAMMTVVNNWFVVKKPLALSISMASNRARFRLGTLDLWEIVISSLRIEKNEEHHHDEQHCCWLCYIGV
jgi:hypothetical protein